MAVPEEDMSQNNDDDTNNGNTGVNNNGVDVESLVNARVDAAIKDIKEKLNKAYQSRDEALDKAKKLEEERRADELKRLENEGKALEALQHRYDDLAKENEALKRANIELSRDVTLRELMSGLPFRNDRAAKLAYKEIVAELQQDANGDWKHKSGVSLKDYVSQFANDEDQAFLFKPKTSSGTGVEASGTGNTPSTKEKATGSLFGKSQEEVLKLAAEGKLRKS